MPDISYQLAALVVTGVIPSLRASGTRWAVRHTLITLQDFGFDRMRISFRRQRV